MMLTGGIEAGEGELYFFATGVLAGGSGALATGADCGAGACFSATGSDLFQSAAWRGTYLSKACALRLDLITCVSPSNAKAAQRSAVQPSRTASTWATTPKRSSSIARRRPFSVAAKLGSPW